MSNVAAPSKAGSLADSEVALGDVATRRLLLHDQWDLAGLGRPAADSEVASVVVSMVGEEAAAAASEVAFKIVEATAVVEEEVLVIKAAAPPEVALAAATAVGILARTDTVHPRMRQLGQVARAPVLSAAAATAEAGMAALAHRIATVLAPQGRVGMTRVVAVAHMMTDPAVTAAAAVEAMGTANPLEAEAVAIWSR